MCNGMFGRISSYVSVVRRPAAECRTAIGRACSFIVRYGTVFTVQPYGMLSSSPVSSSTVVSCVEKEDSGQTNLMVLRTSSEIEIEILVPNENFVPLGVLRRAGNFVMQRVVDIGVPQVRPSQFPSLTIDCLSTRLRRVNILCG